MTERATQGPWALEKRSLPSSESFRNHWILYKGDRQVAELETRTGWPATHEDQGFGAADALARMFQGEKPWELRVLSNDNSTNVLFWNEFEVFFRVIALDKLAVFVATVLGTRKGPQAYAGNGVLFLIYDPTNLKAARDLAARVLVYQDSCQQRQERSYDEALKAIVPADTLDHLLDDDDVQLEVLDPREHRGSRPPTPPTGCRWHKNGKDRWQLGR